MCTCGERPPAGHGEGIQILKYEIGQKYEVRWGLPTRGSIPNPLAESLRMHVTQPIVCLSIQLPIQLEHAGRTLT